MFSGCAGSGADATQAPVASEAAAQATPPDGMSETEMAELEKKMMESAQPGPEHETLAKMAGDWEMQTLFTMGPEPMKFSATVHSEMILGGRFLLQTVSGSAGEFSMDSVSIMGFDRRHGVYTVYGCDSMGTYCVGAQGPMDAKTQTITMYGEDEDPIAGLTQKYDIVVMLNADGSYTTKVVFKPGTFGNDEPLVAVTNTYTKK